MKKNITLIVLGFITMTLVGCNKSPINLYDYSHKPPIQFEDSDDTNSFIDSILNP